MTKSLLWLTAIFLLLLFTPVLAKTQSNITGTFESRSFEFTNLSAIYHPEGYPSTYEIVGIAHNIANSTYENIQLSAELYDINNTLIGVEKGSPNVEGMPPGTSSPFKISTSESVKNSDFDHFRISVAAIKSEENGANNSLTTGSSVPTKEGYDNCANFAGKSFCDAIIYEACMGKVKIAVTAVFNQTACDNLLKTLKSNYTQNGIK